VFLPALYPGSHESRDEQVKIGRLTDWQDQGGGVVLGQGMRMFLVDDDAVPVLEWRTLRLTPVEPA
jgi:protein involved in temperature-dependent protein secretion